MKLVVALFFATVVAGGNTAGAQLVHHVLSGDRTSDMTTDVGSWSSGRIYRVGDHLCKHHFSLLCFYHLPIYLSKNTLGVKYYKGI